MKIDISFGKKKKLKNKKKTQKSPLEIIEEEEGDNSSDEDDVRLKLKNVNKMQKENKDKKNLLSLPNTGNNRPRTPKKPNSMMIEVKNHKDSDEITLTKESVDIPVTPKIEDDSDESAANSDLEEVTTTENNVKTTFQRTKKHKNIPDMSRLSKMKRYDKDNLDEKYSHLGRLKGLIKKDNQYLSEDILDLLDKEE